MDTINKKTDSRKPNIKHHNVRYVLSILKKHGVSTASEILKESNLSVTTIVKILDILKREGLAKSCGKGPSQGRAESGRSFWRSMRPTNM